MKLVLALTLFALLPAAATGTEASAEIFPALRKRMQKQKLAAAQTHASVAPAVDEKDTDDAPVGPVPPAPDAGADGFPQLPEVSTMLKDASGTLKSVNSQASSLEARVVQAQMQSESKMAKQKAAFEQKLKQQEQGNTAVIKANAGISAEIKKLQDGNAALRKHSHEIEETSKVTRSELKTLQARLGVAKDFTAQSLTSTDDSKNSLLQVLKKGKGKHHHAKAFVETGSKKRTAKDDDDGEDDDTDDSEDSEESSNDKDDDEEDDEAPTSLLSLSSKVHRADNAAASFESAMSDLESAVPAGASPDVSASVPASNPDDLLEVLSKDVAHLAQQEKESEKNLKNIFIKDFRAGAKRHSVLLVQQKELIATRGSLQALQAKLKTAEAHLEGTRSQLDGRLRGLGQYIQKLAHLALAPQHEVPHLIEVLPKEVAVHAEKKKVV